MRIIYLETVASGSSCHKLHASALARESEGRIATRQLKQRFEVGGSGGGGQARRGAQEEAERKSIRAPRTRVRRLTRRATRRLWRGAATERPEIDEEDIMADFILYSVFGLI